MGMSSGEELNLSFFVYAIYTSSRDAYMVSYNYKIIKFVVGFMIEKEGVNILKML